MCVRNANRMSWKKPFRHLTHNQVIRLRLIARNAGVDRVAVVPICDLRETYGTGNYQSNWSNPLAL